MNRNFALLFLFCASFSLALQTASAVTIQWSPVGNPGNANDPATGTLYGGVDYSYKIGTYDVTNGQYAEFLNTKDPTGSNLLGLWDPNMGTSPYGGISFFGDNLPGSKYAVISGDGNHPVNYITFYDAVRFANWLNNGQGNGDTETGAYTLLGGTPTPSNGSSLTRNSGATVFVPSENEWYKAAYYDPRTTAHGGPPADSHYWLYPTSSNSAPAAEAPPGGSNSANYNSVVANLTDVGAYTGTTSPAGAFDMGGDVWQWDEAVTGTGVGTFRGLRGGLFKNPFNFINGSNFMRSSNQTFGGPTTVDYGNGFRVASVPEPSTAILVAFAFGIICLGRNRFTPPRESSFRLDRTTRRPAQ